MILILKPNLLFQNTRLFEKNKEKNITKVRFIDLPDNLKEKKNKKAKYIAQKSFVSKKNVKKNNPLIKPKQVKKQISKPKKKTAVVKETIPLIPSNSAVQILPKSVKKRILKKNKSNKQVKKKVQRKKLTKVKKVKKVVKKNIDRIKPVKIRKPLKPLKTVKSKSKKIIKKNKRKIKKREMLTLNKVTPTYEELIEKGLMPSIKNKKKSLSKGVKSKKSLPRVYKDIQVQKLSPNIFKSSHIYPDDIDISDSVSISTQSSRFASYLHKVKRKIELVWEYPRIAGEMGIQGKLFIKFKIDKSGRLVAVQLLKSSGAPILDREAIKAIKEAAPYPPFPKDNSFGVDNIKIHACFEYVIGGKDLW